MTASAAPSAIRLPRAIERQLAATAARYAAAETGASPSADATAAPAATPAATPATTPETPAAPAADPRENDPNYWRQRFSVTSGILAKERAARQEERAEWIRKNTELQSQATSSTTTVADTDAEINLADFYTPAQIEAYGEEQCRVMAKTAMDAARKTAQKLIDDAVRPLREERERETTDKATARKAAFVDKLIELVPDYQTIDVDPRWSDETTGWLAQEDENGVQRQQLLNIHIGNFDAPRVAKMFKQFLKSVETTAPVPPVAPSGTGAAPAGDGTPPASASGALTAPTDQEVKDFFKKSSLGKVKDDERVAFEARLKLRVPQG